LADSVLIQQQHRQLSENRSVASASESGNRVAQASSNLQFSVAPGNRATMPASVPSHSALAHISNDPRVAAPQGSVRRHSSDSTTRVRVLLCSHDSPSPRLFLSYFAFDERTFVYVFHAATSLQCSACVYRSPLDRLTLHRRRVSKQSSK
jgi:hypothetical protein